MSLDFAILSNEITTEYLDGYYIIMSDSAHFVIYNAAKENNLALFLRINDPYEDFEIKYDELGDFVEEINILEKDFSDNTRFKHYMDLVRDSGGVTLDRSIFEASSFLEFFDSLKQLNQKAKGLKKSIHALSD